MQFKPDEIERSSSESKSESSYLLFQPKLDAGQGRAVGLFSRSACEALDRASQLSLSYLVNLRWRRSLFFIGFWGPEFVLFILLAFRLIVRENDDRFFFHESRLQFLRLKNNLQCSFEGHISQFNAEPVLLDCFVEFYS